MLEISTLRRSVKVNVEIIYDLFLPLYPLVLVKKTKRKVVEDL